MGFNFKKSACVVAGTFNMYIVQPAWLVKIGIMPKSTGVTIASKLDEPGFRFSSPKLPYRWLVTPNRIEVETETLDVNCGEMVAAVLQALPWTPLVAIGNNAIYTANIAELEALPKEFRSSPQAADGYEVTQRSFHYALTRDKRITNLQLSIGEDDLELSINVHTELRERDIEAAKSAAHAFLRDRIDSEHLAQEYFKAEFNHGNSDK